MASLAQAAASIASTSLSTANFLDSAKPAVVGRLNAEDRFLAGNMLWLTKEPPLLPGPFTASD